MPMHRAAGGPAECARNQDPGYRCGSQEDRELKGVERDGGVCWISGGCASRRRV